MIFYKSYRRDIEGREVLLGTLPERRRNPKRISRESILNWAKRMNRYDAEIDINDIYFKCSLVTNEGGVCQPEDEFDQIMMKFDESHCNG
jgi:hypothetical protein